MFIATDSKIPEALFNAEALGGKGFGLCWMQQQGINVPPALIIPTSACLDYMVNPNATMSQIASEYDDITGYFIDKFGYMPLLSVRSGARASMPGMMDTILNAGLDFATLPFWKEKLGADCANDSFHRLNSMYGSVVLGYGPQMIKDVFPLVPDAKTQILNSIEAVFKSWNNDRAKFYRKMNNIPESWGTAVTLQAMVFGNLGDTSGTGVLFTRNPDSGEDMITGEFLINAQGEDVVAGTRTPMPLSKMDAWNKDVATELLVTVSALEKLRGDVQDVEFTIQEGKLYILQTRNAKRSARAAVKIAVDMLSEGILTSTEALKRVTASQYDKANQDVLDPEFKAEALYTGIPACSGVVTGVVVKTAAAAKAFKGACILVTKETTPDDIEGMYASVGVLTMEGGATSHAAVVARGMNKPCIVGLSKPLAMFKEGEEISICGETGRVWAGKVPVVKGSENAALKAFDNLLHADCFQITRESGTFPALFQVGELKLNIELAVQLIAKATEGRKTLYVDLTPDPTETVKTFMSMFAESDMDTPLLDCLAKLPTSIRNKLVIITDKQLSGNQNVLKTMPVAMTVEQLIVAGTEVIWAGAETEASKKVLAWREAEGSLPSIIGAYSLTAKSFQTKSQAIARLLG